MGPICVPFNTLLDRSSRLHGWDGKAMAAGGKNYFPELTGIRAVTMYGIYNCHFNLIDPAIYGNTLYRLGQEMHLGVPIFYVLSGFLIYYLYGHNLKRISLPWALDYAKNRVARIYPVYFVLLTFTYLWSGFPDSTRETIITYTLTQALFPDLVHAGIPQTWTLTIEETFYFSAPIIFLVALRWGLFVPCFAIVLLGIFLVTVNFPFNPYYGNPSHVFGRTLCGMIACFGCGIWLGKIVRGRGGNMPRRTRPVFTYGALACMFAIMLVQTRLAEIAEAWHPGGDLVRGSEHPLGFFLSYGVFPGLVMVWFWGMMTEPSAVKRFLSIPLVVLLGRSSYCFYLLHFGAVSELFERFVTDSRLGQILLLNLVAVGMFKLIEHPANQYIKFLGRPPKSADDLFGATLNRRSLVYVALFAVILVVQLVPLSLVTQHRADTAYTLLAAGGWFHSMMVALYVAAGVIFACMLFRFPVGTIGSSVAMGRKIALAILAATTLLVAGEEVNWGGQFIGGSAPPSAVTSEMGARAATPELPSIEHDEMMDRLRMLWVAVVCVYIGGGAVVSARFSAIKQRAEKWGLPLASPQLGILLGASLLWYLGVDRSVGTFSVVLGFVVLAFAVEVLFESGSTVPTRQYFGTLFAVCVTALPLFVVSVATGNPADAPRVRAARLAQEAEEWFAQGEVNKSIEVAEASVRLWPDDAEAQFVLGQGYLQQGQLELAAAAFSRAIDLDGGMSEAHDGLGVVRLEQGRPSEAGVQFQAAISANPRNFNAHYNLAVVFERLGNIEQAIAEFEIALRIAPNFQSAQDSLTRLRARLEETP